MARVPNRSGSGNNPFDRQWRPPVHAFAEKSTVELLEEYDRVNLANNVAAGDLHRFRTNRAQLEAEAKRAETLVAAQAVRAGQAPERSTVAEDMQEQERELEAAAAAYTEALAGVTADLYDAQARERANGVHDRRAKAAQAKLDKAAAALAEAVAEAVTAAAMLDWVGGGRVFDVSQQLDPADLVPAIRGQMASQGLSAVTAAHVIDVVRSVVTEN